MWWLAARRTRRQLQLDAPEGGKSATDGGHKISASSGPPLHQCLLQNSPRLRFHRPAMMSRANAQLLFQRRIELPNIEGSLLWNFGRGHHGLIVPNGANDANTVKERNIPSA